MKKYVALTALFLFWLKVAGQQSPQYSQYIFNSTLINPAYAGSKELWQVNALHRTQWTTLSGKPVTQTLVVDGVVANNRIGLGLHLINDQIGAQQHRSFMASFATRVQVGAHSFLRFGVSGGAKQYRLDLTKITTNEAEPDPVFTGNNSSSVAADLAAGTYFHSDNFYAGLSGQNLFQQAKFSGIKPDRSYYFTTGYVFDVNTDFKVKPSLLIKEDFKAPTSTDLSAFVLYRELIWVGLTYRNSLNLASKNNLPDNLSKGGAFAYLAEFYPTDNIRIGYAYDVSIVPEFRNFRTHEVSVGYMFRRKNDPSTLTPRFF